MEFLFPVTKQKVTFEGEAFKENRMEKLKKISTNWTF